MNVRTRLERSTESGAVAVLFALLAVVVIGSGALAVDLGNAFARKRISQTQADLAVLAGAAELPAAGAAIELAFNYLWDNGVLGQFGDKETVKAQMKNPSRDDGDIWVDADGHLNVLTPPAQVDYALGGVFQQSGIDVQAYAQAGIFSPGGALAPFFLPHSCTTPLPDSVIIKDTGLDVPDPDPVLLTPMVAPSGTPKVADVDPAEVAYGAAANLRPFSDGEMVADSDILTSVEASFAPSDVGADVVVEDAAVRLVTDASIDEGTSELSSATADFSPADEEATVRIVGAGPSGALLTATVDAVVSSTVVQISVDASTTTTDASMEIVPVAGPDLVSTVVAYVGPDQVQLADEAIDSVSGATGSVTAGSSLTITVFGTGFEDAGDGVVSMEVAFIRGSEQFVVPVTGDAVDNVTQPNKDSIIVTVPQEVLDTASSLWYVQVRQPGGEWSLANPNSSTNKSLSVSASDEAPDSCVGQNEGSFGLIDSPRLGESGSYLSQNDRLAINIARGLDHPIQVFENVDVSGIPLDAPDNCSDPLSSNTPVSGGVFDDESNHSANPRITPNCLGLNSGTVVSAATAGLIKGDSNPEDYDGRLQTGPTPPCSRPNLTRFGESVNDDVLSCFLRDGSVEGAISGAASMFYGSVVESPRFMMVPVLWVDVDSAVQSAQVGNNKYYPIERFVGVFITDEPDSATSATGGPESSENGVYQQGNGEQKVGGIKAVPFELDRLPDQVSYSGKVIPYIGDGPKVVRLLK